MDFDTPTSEHERPSPRKGRARERVRRRQEREAMLKTGERPAAQLAPSGQFKLPALSGIDPRLLGLVIGGVILVLGILFALSRLTGTTIEPVTPPNALWLGTEWTYNLDEDAEVSDLVVRLREHEIGTVYAWMSWLQADLTWAGKRDENGVFGSFADVEADVQAFVDEFNLLYPEANLYAWISMPVGANGRDMDDAMVQQRVVELSQRALTEFGFDGIFLNIEPVWNNDASFLRFLAAVREALGQEVFISAAIPPDWSPLGATIPVPPLIAPGTAWDERYKQSVALLVNELALMAYNSGLSDPQDYAEWMAYQVSTYASALAGLDTGSALRTHIMVGIPTYAAEPPGHDPLVENVPSAIQGVRLGLQQAGENARYVRGVAIYADWETDETEWAQFMQAWVSGGTAQ